MLRLATLLLSTSFVLAHPVAAQESISSLQSVKEEQQSSVEEANATAVTQREPRAPTQQIDIRIYGGEPLTAPEKYAAPRAQYETPKPVSAAEAVAGSSLLAEGAAAMAAAKRDKATTLSSAAAGASLFASNLNPSREPGFAQDPEFNSGEFMRKVVDFTLDLSDEKFMLEAKSEEDARYRMDVLRERQHKSTIWQQNSLLIKSVVGAVITVALLIWWWSSLSPRATRWAIRGVVLLGSFYIHWAFGLFMLFGLYTYVTRSHGR